MSTLVNHVEIAIIDVILSDSLVVIYYYGYVILHNYNTICNIAYDS